VLRLKSIRLAGWKSIRDMDPPLELRAVNVLIGANGSGKSNLVEVFKLLHEAIWDRLPEYIARAGGPDSLLHFGLKRTPEIRIELEFEANEIANRYSLNLVPVSPFGMMIAREELEQRGVLGQAVEAYSPATGPYPHSILTAEMVNRFVLVPTIRKALFSCRVFHFHDTSSASPMRRDCYVEANRHLYADGGNLPAMLYRYKLMQPRVYERIRANVRLIAPFFDDFVLEPMRLNTKQILLNWRARGSEYEFGPHQLSDGTLRAIALCTLLLQPEEELPRLILLDEPELGLHPAALANVAAMLHGASLHSQLLIATQSVVLLNHFEPDQVVAVDHRDGVSTFRRLSNDDYSDWLDEYTLGDLWERNVIGGGPGR